MMFDNAPMDARARKWTKETWIIPASDGKRDVQTFVIANVNGKKIGVVQFERLEGRGVTCRTVDWSLCEREIRWQLGNTGDDETAAMVGLTIRGVRIRKNSRKWDDQLRDASYTASPATSLHPVECPPWNTSHTASPTPSARCAPQQAPRRSLS
jgi:hypothetical protein